ncbi:NUDIX hydrolase [Pseudogemmobacter sonorensis]|uniref:NUDIX hydrolase n=1 Tax=Pseudogemmobacter sonorensis TaxID=2989681 RepID=UPI00369B551F
MTTEPGPPVGAGGFRGAFIGDFIGAKAAFFCGTRLLCYLRDDRPELPFPGHWDLPGGGREGDETPEACLLRELEEEFGLRLPPARLEQRLILPSMTDPARVSVFFAGRIAQAELSRIRFGTEGQRWEAMEVAAFLRAPRAVAALQDRVRRVMGAYGLSGSG